MSGEVAGIKLEMLASKVGSHYCLTVGFICHFPLFRKSRCKLDRYYTVSFFVVVFLLT